jgi:hypothetical protein
VQQNELATVSHIENQQKSYPGYASAAEAYLDYASAAEAYAKKQTIYTWEEKEKAFENYNALIKELKNQS